MAEFVVSGVVGHEETVLVASSGAADDAGAAHSGLDHRHERSELALEDAVEVVGSAGSHEAVAVGKLAEDADIVGVLVLDPVCHANYYL